MPAPPSSPPTNRFSRDAASFGLCVSVLFVSKFVFSKLPQFVSMAVNTAAFYWLAAKTTSVVRGILFELCIETPRHVLKWALPGAALSAIAFGRAWGRDAATFVDALSLSILISAALFGAAAAGAAASVGSGLIGPALIRRGLFAVSARALILARSVVLCRVWGRFLLGQARFHAFLAAAYGVVKFGLVCCLASDLWHVAALFRENAALMFRDGAAGQQCPICHVDEAEEPKALACGHTFCYACIYECFRRKPTCPMCMRTGTAPHTIELADGAIPVLVFLGAL